MHPEDILLTQVEFVAHAATYGRSGGSLEGYDYEGSVARAQAIKALRVVLSAGRSKYQKANPESPCLQEFCYDIWHVVKTLEDA